MATQSALEKAKIDQIQKRIKEQIVKEYSKLVTGIDENLRAFINTIINEDFTSLEFWKEDNLIYIPATNQKVPEKVNKKDSDVQEISPRKSPVYPSQPRKTNFPVVHIDQQRRRQRPENDHDVPERNKVATREVPVRERDPLDVSRRQVRRGGPLMITYDKRNPEIQEIVQDAATRGGEEKIANNYAKLFRNYSDGKQPSSGRTPPISINNEPAKRIDPAKALAPSTFPLPSRANARIIPREQPAPRAARDSSAIRPASRMTSPAVNNRATAKVQNIVEDIDGNKNSSHNIPARNNRNDRKRPSPITEPDIFENEPRRAKRKSQEKPKGPLQGSVTKPDKEELQSQYTPSKPAPVKKTLGDNTSSLKTSEDVKVEKTIKGFKCHQCGTAAHTAQDLAMHLEFFHKAKISITQASPSSAFNCDLCDYDGKNKIDLERHNLQNHGKMEMTVLPVIPAVKKRGAFKCERCPYSSNKRMYLNQHMKHTHHA